MQELVWKYSRLADGADGPWLTMHLPPVVSHVPTQSVLLEHDFGPHCELAHVMSVPHWLSLEHDW